MTADSGQVSEAGRHLTEINDRMSEVGVLGAKELSQATRDRLQPNTGNTEIPKHQLERRELGQKANTEALNNGNTAPIPTLRGLVQPVCST